MEGLFEGRHAVASLASQASDFDYASASAVNIMSVMENPRVRSMGAMSHLAWFFQDEQFFCSGWLAAAFPFHYLKYVFVH